MWGESYNFPTGGSVTHTSLPQYGAGGNQWDNYLQAILEAMRTTQGRAEADRNRALDIMGGLTSDVTGSPEYQDLIQDIARLRSFSPQSAVGDILGSPEYSQWAQAVSQELASPEAINEDVANQIYSKSRVPVEAQTQQMLKNIQRNYYSGMPSGMQQQMIQQAELSKTGQLSNVMRDIQIERALRRKEDERRAIELARQLGVYSGGVREREAGRTQALGLQKLLGVLGGSENLARLLAGLKTTEKQNLVDILSHTIAEVPKLSGGTARQKAMKSLLSKYNYFGYNPDRLSPEQLATLEKWAKARNETQSIPLVSTRSTGFGVL